MRKSVKSAGNPYRKLPVITLLVFTALLVFSCDLLRLINNDETSRGDCILTIKGLPESGDFTAYVYKPEADTTTYSAIENIDTSLCMTEGVFISGERFNLIYIERNLPWWGARGFYPVVLYDKNGVSTDSNNPKYRYTFVTFKNGCANVHFNEFLAVVQKELPVLNGTVSITGTAQVGQTLTANTTALEGSGDISYQWKRNGTNIETNSNIHTVKTEDLGSTITVTVTRSGNSGSVTSNPTAAVILPALTGTVSITGIAQVGQTLTANTCSLGGSGVITFQWMRDAVVIGSNSNIYTVQIDDVGSVITVTVIRSDNSGSVISEPTAEVPPALTGTVSITGTALMGQTLTANTNALDSTGTISYQWKRDGTNAGSNSNT